MLTPLFGPVRQTAYIVPDIETAIEDWGSQLGIGPFALCREITPLAGSTFRGEPTAEVVMNVAFAYIDDLQLELIEQVNETPSMYREAVERSGFGHHHYGFCVEDFDATYGRAMTDGFDAVVDAGVKGYARQTDDARKRIGGHGCGESVWNDLTRPYFDGIRKFLDEADDAQRIHELDLMALVTGGSGATG